MRLFQCLAVLLFASAAWGQPPADLVRQLREGGYVLYMRHASTDFSQNDSRMKSYEDCASQRNLTEKGRQEAREIGGHVKRLRIPIGEVLASPFCRTMETARLAVLGAAAIILGGTGAIPLALAAGAAAFCIVSIAWFVPLRGALTETELAPLM